MPWKVSDSYKYSSLLSKFTTYVHKNCTPNDSVELAPGLGILYQVSLSSTVAVPDDVATFPLIVLYSKHIGRLACSLLFPPNVQILT